MRPASSTIRRDAWSVRKADQTSERLRRWPLPFRVLFTDRQKGSRFKNRNNVKNHKNGQKLFWWKDTSFFRSWKIPADRDGCLGTIGKKLTGTVAKRSPKYNVANHYVTRTVCSFWWMRRYRPSQLGNPMYDRKSRRRLPLKASKFLILSRDVSKTITGAQLLSF